MTTEAEITPLARVFFLDDQAAYPGWYLQRYERGELVTTRLRVNKNADAFSAALEAAGWVGCIPEEVQIEGPCWPPRQ